MRLFLLSLLTLTICCSTAIIPAQAQPAHTEIEPGLVEKTFEPFLESDAYPLETLIAFNSANMLVTYRGRCVSLDIFGADQSARCEPRMVVTYSADDASIRWFTFEGKAFGLESDTNLEPARDGVLRLKLKRIHMLKDGGVSSEAATGDCRIDAFYNECHAAGATGRVDVNFAKLGGQATRQFPIEDSIFRIPNAEVFVARGQCLKFFNASHNLTPYCAGFVTQAVLDQKRIMTLFTVDARTVFGFSGLIANKQEGADGHSFTIPVTFMLWIAGDAAGTAPISGTCHESETAGHMTVDCKVTTKREGAVFEASFVAQENWRKPRGHEIGH